MILFACSCGRKLRAQDENARQHVTCPDCGARVRIPDAPKPTELAGDPPRARRLRRPAAEEALPSRTGLFVGLVIAGVGVLAALAVVLILVLGGGGGGASPAPQTEAQQLSKNNLKRIAIAMHHYNDAMGRLPPAVVYDKTGKPLYGWRVLLLPYVEHDDVYRAWHFHEAWDSPHNMALAARMPKVYAHPQAISRTETHYQVFNGPGAVWNSPMTSARVQSLIRFHGVPLPAGQEVFEVQGGPRIPATFQDGTSNTILVAEAAEPAPWSKPADLPFDVTQPLPRLGGLYSEDLFCVAMADGSQRSVSLKKVSVSTLRAAITPAGNEILGDDWRE
jgi:hypothetical protein